jgi:hypothetical protein
MLIFGTIKMSKKYISGETKEQRKARKSKEKRSKALDELVKLNEELGVYDIPYNENPLLKENYYVLCLKHGTKYSAEYVNRLYNMVQRNCTLDVEFVCLTDDSKGIDPRIKILSLPTYLKGWWCKPYMFSNDLPLKGTVLYMDLDVVIAKNIDQLFTYYPQSWCTIRDFTRKMRPTWEKYNSSIVRFRTGTMDQFWENFKNNSDQIQKKFYGDQDWLFDATHIEKPAKLYPDEWIQSWKWEVRQNKDLNRGARGSRQLRVIEHVTPGDECCVCVFHGDPNPENCLDPWVVNNWK